MAKVTLRKAREIVLSERDIPAEVESSIRPEVLSSWRRSLLSGAEVGRPELPYVGELDTDTALCAAADPVLRKLAERLSGLGAGVLLADRHARILRRWVSDANIRPLLDTLRSDAGFTGSEEVVGTNGIGTVAETGQPVQIVGHEHLMESMTPFACVGVPVFHPITHRPEGIITMSCRADASSALLTPLMMSAAADVEHRMLEQASRRERLVLNAYLEASRGGTRRVAGVGQDIFIAGPKVTALLGATHQVVLWETVRAALGGQSVAESELRLDGGQVISLRCQPITHQGDVVGAVVDFGSPRRADVTSHSAPSIAAQSSPRTGAVPGMAGESAAWRDAVTTTRRFISANGPFLVSGEAGVGKCSLVQRLISESDPSASLMIVEMASPGWAEMSAALDSLESILAEGPSVVLLRHIEALPAPVAEAIAARLSSHRGPTRVVSTLTSASGIAATSEHARLVAVVGGLSVHIPPLRERPDDIPPIAHSVLEDAGRRVTVAHGALRALVRAPWPGNVRQLRSVLHSSLSNSLGDIQEAHLPPEIRACATRRQLTTLEHVELRAILDALKQARGNKVVAAKMVGVSRSTLYRKLNSYRIDPEADYF